MPRHRLHGFRALDDINPDTDGLMLDVRAVQHWHPQFDWHGRGGNPGRDLYRHPLRGVDLLLAVGALLVTSLGPDFWLTRGKEVKAGHSAWMWTWTSALCRHSPRCIR